MDNHTPIRERNEYPQLMNAKHLMSIGIPRARAYQLLNTAGLPVVKLGGRKFMVRDRFFKWLDEQAANHSEGNSTVSAE